MNSSIVTNLQELKRIRELLISSNLPFQDIKLENNLFKSYHDENGRLIGVGGLELYSRLALLRSVAVIESERGKNHGKSIVGDLLAAAKSNAIIEVYLLTETASDFFLKRGFEDIPRDQVPGEISNSSEFTTVCPRSASLMRYRIKF